MSSAIANTLSELMMKRLRYQSSFESQKRFKEQQDKKYNPQKSSYQNLSKQNSYSFQQLLHQRSQSQQSLQKPQIILKNEEGLVIPNLQRKHQSSLTNAPNSPQKFNEVIPNSQKNKGYIIDSVHNEKASANKYFFPPHSSQERVLKRDENKKPSIIQQCLSSTATSINQSGSSKNINLTAHLLPTATLRTPSYSNIQSLSVINQKSFLGSSRASRQLNNQDILLLSPNQSNGDLVKAIQGSQQYNGNSQLPSLQKQKYSISGVSTDDKTIEMERITLDSPVKNIDRKGNRQLNSIINNSNRSIDITQNGGTDTSPIKTGPSQMNGPQRKYINIAQNYHQQMQPQKNYAKLVSSAPKLNDSSLNKTSTNYQNQQNCSQIPLSSQASTQDLNTKQSQTSINYFTYTKNKEKILKNQKQALVNIPSFLRPSEQNIQIPLTKHSSSSRSKANMSSSQNRLNTNNPANLNFEGLSLESKEQQIEMVLLTNKKLHNNQRQALKKELAEIQRQRSKQYEDFIFERIHKELKTYQVTHHYTCEQLIDTLIGTARDLSNFKNPKIVIRSIEKNFGYLQKSLEFLSFDQIANMKEIEVEPYLKKLAIACSKVEGEEVLFKPNKKLLDGLLDITSKLEERLIIYQKDHFQAITNSLIEKNEDIKGIEMDLEERYIEQNKKGQYLELKQSIDSKYAMNMRHMETQFYNSYKKNKDKFGNFKILCKRNLNICKNLDGVVTKLKGVMLESQQQQN